MERKIRAGAEFVQTQIVFDVERAKRFIRELNDSSVPILIGVFPCKSVKVAEFIISKIPGILVPKEYVEGLRKAESGGDGLTKKKNIDEINVEYFSEMIRELRKTTRAAGIHIMTMGYEEIVGKITDRVEKHL